jgi:lauroyl/myristoyl acyltransferase
MLSIWANLTLLLGAIIVVGILWFILTVIGQSLFEDLFSRIGSKFRRKKKKDKDRYVY